MKNLIKQILIITLAIIISFTGYSQIAGKVIDETTGQPMPFVNVGLKGKGIGTVTNEQGDFVLNISDDNKKDTLKISHLGYRNIEITLEQINNSANTENLVFEMELENYELKEFVIQPKKVWKKQLGNEVKNNAVTFGFTTNNLGCEVGVEMKVPKNKRCFIDSIFFNIAKCRYDSILFRVNIYSIKNDLPDSNLLTKPLYIVYAQESGTMKLDVTSLHLETNDDFVVTLEWLKDLEGGHKNLSFAAGLTKRNSYARDASQDNWEKIPIGVGFYAHVRFEKEEK